MANRPVRPRKKPPLFGPEDNEARALMRWVQMHKRRFPGLAWFTHIPNEGRRNPSKARQIGIMSGIPDFMLMEPRGQYHGLWIELKRRNEKGKTKGRPSESQIAWVEQLRTKGYVAEIAYGWEQAVDVLKKYMELPEGA